MENNVLDEKQILINNCNDILKIFEFYKKNKDNSLFSNKDKIFIPDPNALIGRTNLHYNQFLPINDDGSYDGLNFFNNLDINTDTNMYKRYHFVKEIHKQFNDITKSNIIKFYFMLDILYKYCINLFNSRYYEFSFNSDPNELFRDYNCAYKIKIKINDINEYIEKIINFIKTEINNIDQNNNIDQKNIEEIYKKLIDGSSFKEEESKKQQAAKEQAAKKQAAKGYFGFGGKKYLRNKKTINPRIKKTKKTKKRKSIAKY